MKTRKYTEAVKKVIAGGNAKSVYAVAKEVGIYYSQANREVQTLIKAGEVADTWSAKTAFSFDTLGTKRADVLEAAFTANTTVSNQDLCKAMGVSRLPKDVLAALTMMEQQGVLTRNFAKVGQPVTYTFKG